MGRWSSPRLLAEQLSDRRDRRDPRIRGLLLVGSQVLASQDRVALAQRVIRIQSKASGHLRQDRHRALELDEPSELQYVERDGDAAEQPHGAVLGVGPCDLKPELHKKVEARVRVRDFDLRLLADLDPTLELGRALRRKHATRPTVKYAEPQGRRSC